MDGEYVLSINETSIPFGLKEGRLVDVSEVNKGLACDCFCPCCGANLQARKGEINQHHFAHVSSDDMKECRGALETAIHLMAKQIIEEEKAFSVPEYAVTETAKDLNGVTHRETGIIEEQMLKQFDTVTSESRIADIRPDIIGEFNGEKLIIEIAVTSMVQQSKQKKISKLGLAALEITIKDRFLSKDGLRQLLIKSTADKKWLFHPKEKEQRRKLNEALVSRIKRIKPQIRAVMKRVQQPYAKNKISVPIRARLPSKQEFDTRWFLCEACREIWSSPKELAPYTLDKIDCPECAHEVSTLPCGL